MTYSSDELRQAAFQIMESAGNPAIRTNTGQQWLVELADGKSAILKTASKGGLMVRTTSEDNDSDIVGFNATEVTHILAIVCLPGGNTVTAYVIPIEVVEAAYRRNNKEWMEQKAGRASMTWVLHFDRKHPSFYGDNMAEEWAKYSVGTLSMDANANSPKAVLQRARKDIAKAYGVTSDQVKISVDL